MQRFFVTGANKGIGLAIAKGLVDKGHFVFLGSRDVARGEAAAATLDAAKVQVVQLDLTSKASIEQAAKTVGDACGEGGLEGLINNAGGGASMNFTDAGAFLSTMALNYQGTVDVTTAVMPLIAKTGRIVMISSGAAPSFVQKLSEARQAMFLESGDVTMEQIAELVAGCTKIATTEGATKESFGADGYGEGAPYGLSKACVNAYTTVLATANPGMKINACSPGWIETDLTRPFAVAAGKTPKEMGMLTPEQGATSPLYLALGDVPGSGWYFGSDAVRSPPHKYRSPGETPYNGDPSWEGKAALG